MEALASILSETPLTARCQSGTIGAWNRQRKNPARELRPVFPTACEDTLEQAAELLGATVNQFVVQTAYVEAQRVIERESVIRLSQRDAHKVLALLDNPPKPNRRLKDAVKAFKGTVSA